MEVDGLMQAWAARISFRVRSMERVAGWWVSVRRTELRHGAELNYVSRMLWPYKCRFAKPSKVVIDSTGRYV
jgi:hypothetical protein